MGGSFYPHTFEGAVTYLAGGRNKSERKVENNTRLYWVDEDTITMVLHRTPILTFHRDGTKTLYMGGYNTNTTRNRLHAYAGRPTMTTMPDTCSGKIAVAYTDELTPARVQKCRSCKGRGTWMEPSECREASYWGDLMCIGATWKYAVEWDLSSDSDTAWDDHWNSRYLDPCEHGNTDEKRHQASPCSHGQYGSHSTGEYETSCYRCDGVGRVDYGSTRVPVVIDTDDAWRIDADGKYLGPGDPPTGSWNATMASSGGWNKQPALFGSTGSDKHSYGASIADRLGKVLPNIYASVKHPVDGTHYTLRSVIVNLNDTHGWSRERVADWLDTLDLDLRFPTPKENAA